MHTPRDKGIVPHPHPHPNTKHPPGTRQTPTDSGNSHKAVSRPVMIVRATINSPAEEPCRPPHLAPPDTSVRDHNSDPRAEDYIPEEAARRDRIRASERFRELANALNGRRVTIHTQHGPTRRSPENHISCFTSKDKISEISHGRSIRATQGRQRRRGSCEITQNRTWVSTEMTSD